MNILIVDDNKDLAAGLADLLEVEGHKPVVANTARQAQEAFESNRPDYVFLDMKLPDGNGLELYYEFHAKSPATRLILMTGYRIDQLLQQLVDSGTVALLRKPFTMQQVNETLNNVMPGGVMLVADNDTEVADKLQDYLQQQGTRSGIIRHRGDIAGALSQQDNDVLIVELGLPVLCCMEIYFQMKAKGRVIPMIVVVSQVDPDQETDDIFKEISATNCLFKPFHPAQVLDIMHQSSAA